MLHVQAAKRQEVAEIVAALEAHNPTENPTQHLDLVEGTWNLLYTTITITVRWTGHGACIIVLNHHDHGALVCTQCMHDSAV